MLHVANDLLELVDDLLSAACPYEIGSCVPPFSPSQAYDVLRVLHSSVGQVHQVSDPEMLNGVIRRKVADVGLRLLRTGDGGKIGLQGIFVAGDDESAVAGFRGLHRRVQV
ncbi:MAG: hypothetical protein WBS17_03110, partial [Candidatus Acidiferrales bacterium]